MDITGRCTNQACGREYAISLWVRPYLCPACQSPVKVVETLAVPDRSPRRGTPVRPPSDRRPRRGRRDPRRRDSRRG